MKKSSWCVLLVVVMAVLTACGGKQKEIQADTFGKKLADEISFKDEMNELALDKALTLYALDSEVVKSGSCYISSGATAEEIAVFEAKNSDSVKAIREAFDDRIESQKEAFENYVPEELTKLKKPVLQTVGNVVILCVSDHNKEVEKLIEE